MNPFSAPLQGSSPTDEMVMSPDAVGRVARGWDEQHVDLRAAGGQIAHAPTSGFTPLVGACTADFLRAWSEHTALAAELSEQQADSLRAVIGAWIRADEHVGANAFVLQAALEELR